VFALRSTMVSVTIGRSQKVALRLLLRGRSLNMVLLMLILLARWQVVTVAA
jgi:hypothetical protein